ncbi:hypothetical protein E4633_13900 [Geomonas terrae]|uniref:Uncharacterized protein n=1 Tax=Geomonas terrae TaxID=2562681 RepID=A0A4S1CDA8_9BACT|nr:hypothetical protein [Geomonas terrae]TGU71418.1 hypothetical protein E4633_13900 [Geomonas terrae]
MSQVVDLTKHIHPDSLRGIGQRASGLQPHEIIVGGLSISSIQTATKGVAYKIGKYQIKDVFTLDIAGCYFLYVRPLYPYYRKVAKLRFGGIPPMRDVDHVLARTLAGKMNINYVLVALVNSSANRSHGCYEKRGIKQSNTVFSSKVIHADERIYHKILSRPPAARQTTNELRGGFDRSLIVNYGLTLKQKGIWNIALGLDKDAPEDFLQLLQRIEVNGEISNT